MAEKTGKLVISLDFELFWGVRDHKTLLDYGENITGASFAIPSLLELFEQYNIHSTWAFVGFLLCKNKADLIKQFPAKLPNYQNQRLDPYSYIHTTDLDKDSAVHFAPRLIQQIIKTPHQELGTHTLSHFYCIEKGVDKTDFELDLVQTLRLAKNNGIAPTSLIFPRNQVMHLDVLEKLGLASFRGNESHWAYQPTNSVLIKPFKRIIKLVDRYFNLLGHHTYKLPSYSPLVNIPSSRFLAPIKKNYPLLNKLHQNRIKSAMTFAAKNKTIFHLWWHPHNLGVNQKENLLQLKNIFDHYHYLEKQYGYSSLNMIEIANQLQRASA